MATRHNRCTIVLQHRHGFRGPIAARLLVFPRSDLLPLSLTIESCHSSSFPSPFPVCSRASGVQPSFGTHICMATCMTTCTIVPPSFFAVTSRPAGPMVLGHASSDGQGSPLGIVLFHGAKLGRRGRLASTQHAVLQDVLPRRGKSSACLQQHVHAVVLQQHAHEGVKYMSSRQPLLASTGLPLHSIADGMHFGRGAGRRGLDGC